MWKGDHTVVEEGKRTAYYSSSVTAISDRPLQARMTKKAAAAEMLRRQRFDLLGTYTLLS